MPGFFGYQAPFKVLPTGTASSEYVPQTYAGFLSASSAAFLGVVVKQTNNPIAAMSASFNGSFIKKTLFVLSAIGAAFNGSFVKKIQFVLSAIAAAFNGSLVKKVLKVLSALALAFSGSIIKKAIAILSAIGAAFNGSLVKKTLIALSAAASAFSGSLVKKALLILSAVASAFNGSIVKKTLVSLVAMFAALNGSIVKKTLIILSAIATAFNGILAHARVRVLALAAAMAALSGSVAKKILIPLSAIVASLSATQIKFTSRSIVATSAAFSGTINKFTKKFLNALSSAWSAIVNAVKSAAPPVVYKQVVLGTGLRSFGVSFLTPAVITTSSNALQTFQYNGTSFLTVPAGKSSCHIVAGGSVVIPPSGINTALNMVLTLRGFSQRTQPAVAVLDDVLAALPQSQLISVGTTPWQLICKLSGTQAGNAGPQGNKRGGQLTADYIIQIGGVYFSGTLVSSNNPFLEPTLQFSLGAQFTGSVSGADMFQANLYQFETQQ